MKFFIDEQDSGPILRYRVTSDDGEMVRHFDTLKEADDWVKKYDRMLNPERK